MNIGKIILTILIVVAVVTGIGTLLMPDKTAKLVKDLTFRGKNTKAIGYQL